MKSTIILLFIVSATCLLITACRSEESYEPAADESYAGRSSVHMQDMAHEYPIAMKRLENEDEDYWVPLVNMGDAAFYASQMLPAEYTDDDQRTYKVWLVRFNSRLEEIMEFARDENFEMAMEKLSQLRETCDGCHAEIGVSPEW